VRECGRRYWDDEGVGGFLESILVVMTVITASSLFLVMLSVGTVLEDGGPPGLEEVIGRLETEGLWPMGDEPLVLEDLRTRFGEGLTTMEGTHGLCLTFRTMGSSEPLLRLGDKLAGDLPTTSATAPALLSVHGHLVPGMAEMLIW
jgi:hypothetical protein